MADGSLTIRLDDYAVKKLAEKAKATGLSPETIAEILIGNALFDYDDFEWPPGGDPREDHVGNYDLNEPGRPWSEVRPEMVALLQRKLADKA